MSDPIEAVQARFARTLHTRSRSDATLRRRLERLPSLGVPAGLLASLRVALRLGVLTPDAAEHAYGVHAPTQLLDQLASTQPGAALLWRPLRLDALPRLNAALTRALDALEAAGLTPSDAVGADHPAALLRAEGSLAALYGGALFGSGLPMIGAAPQELARLGAHLDRGHDPDALIDLQLAADILHERFHGRRGSITRPPTAWMLQEAASIHLGHAACEAHAFPSAPGEAVVAGGAFVMLALAVERWFGRAALWRVGLHGGDGAAALSPRVHAALHVAEWQQLIRQGRPDFAPDARDLPAWVKLLDAARIPGGPLRALLDDIDPSADLTAPGGPVATLPHLLDAARALPWSSLPWWDAPPHDLDRRWLRAALLGLMRVHRLAPNLQTDPAPLPGDRCVWDVQASTLTAAPQPDGIYAEPARWVMPPNLSRLLATRGIARITLERATRDRLEHACAALWDACTREDAAPTPEITLSA